MNRQFNDTTQESLKIIGTGDTVAPHLTISTFRWTVRGDLMGNFQRKAVLAAASITAGAAVFMSMGSAHAATAASAAPAARAVQANHAAQAAPELAAALTWPTVQQGATGERVFAVQYLLNAHGARLATDGQFGPATAAAVKSFQSKSGLQVDGQVGPLTWARLIVQVKQGNTGSAVSGVQHNLHFAYGYTSVAVDGQFGPITNSAVRSFQAKFKIGVDGIVGPITWNALIVNEG
jgi:peptidoglycan hydrolase-like protein with peptidoglycan-binding domain